MRLRNLIVILAALATVFVLGACASSLGQSGGDQGNQEQGQQEEPPKQQAAPQQGEQDEQDSGERATAVEPPSNNMMRLTVPKMEQIKDDEIPTGLGTDEALLRDYAGVHIKYTGFPWEQEANVYIAGHRLGYENTNSYLAFWDLNKLEEGDEFYIVDSEGRKYVYEVFRKFVTTPDNLSVLNPVKGKNIVTLQTCTLPDYVNRLLVRAELKDIQET